MAGGQAMRRTQAGDAAADHRDAQGSAHRRPRAQAFARSMRA
jgi:hypothetical protein